MASRRHVFSSPALAARAESLVVLSSSPEFPSIEDLIPKGEKKPPLRSGSRAVPISATKSFTTASHFWRSTIDDNNNHCFVEDGSRSSLVVTGSFREPLVSKTAANPLEVIDNGRLQHVAIAPEVPDTRSNLGRKDNLAKRNNPTAREIISPETTSPMAKPWKRYRDKDTTTGQTTISMGKVTKPTVTDPNRKKKRAGAANKHFPVATATEPIEIDDSTELEPALKRRTDWTPTKDTKQPILVLDSSTEKESTSPKALDATASPRPQKNLFRSLRDTYACPDGENLSRASTPFDGPIDILGKRKLIELVSKNDLPGETTPEPSPIKSKAPKKKPRTITELATAAYRVSETSPTRVTEDQRKDENLLNYFGADTGPQSVENDKDTATSCNTTAPKKGAKPKPKKATKKKSEPSRPILLSPASAIRQVSRQDFVFGTSSQLATEQDAAMLRDIQWAMDASNRQEDAFTFSSPIDGSIVHKSSNNRLWAAGARDIDGDLLHVEVIDLLDSPAIPKDLTNPEVVLSLATDNPDVPRQNTAEKLLRRAAASAVFESCTQTKQKPRFFSTQRSTACTSSVLGEADLTTSTLSQQTLAVPAKSVDIDDGPPASNQEHQQLMASSAEETPTATATLVAPPKYELYTDAQLAKEIQGFGFKPLKRRTAAIALLMECWTSQHGNHGGRPGKDTIAPLSTSSAAVAKSQSAPSAPTASRPRGRPKEATSAAASLTTRSASASEVAPLPLPPVKRPRGRPRKDAATTSTTAQSAATKSKSSAKTATPTPATAPASVTTAQPSTPKRKRRAATQPVIEIVDSDLDDVDPFDISDSSSASPAPAKEFSSPAGLDLSITDEDTSALSLTLSPTTQQSALFGHISKAVTTAPPSRDPENPSWHEKILMYDPIVLEDLTAWLNAGQLDRVGFGDEVSSGDVKRWCESKSICCLWRVNLNGKERKRF